MVEFRHVLLTEEDYSDWYGLDGTGYSASESSTIFTNTTKNTSTRSSCANLSMTTTPWLTLISKVLRAFSIQVRGGRD
uniref:Uncharacterized protein n=1 Tax=Physcomitrium patens TaxID=3218 RepID=A0A2K1JE95_PHYPA|nr:hypothetical protein PHYPA_020131 [Physcomitrium patens]